MQKIKELLSLTSDLDYPTLSMGADEALHSTSTAEDPLANTEPDRILVLSTELEYVQELWRKAYNALTVRF